MTAIPYAHFDLQAARSRIPIPPWHELRNAIIRTFRKKVPARTPNFSFASQSNPL